MSSQVPGERTQPSPAGPHREHRGDLVSVGRAGRGGSAGSGRAAQSSQQVLGWGPSLVVWCVALGDQGRGTCEGPRGGGGPWALTVGLHVKGAPALGALLILSPGTGRPQEGSAPGSARTRPLGRTQKTQDTLSTRAQGTSRPTLGHQGRAHQVVAWAARSHVSPMPPASVLSRHLPFCRGAFSPPLVSPCPRGTERTLQAPDQAWPLAWSRGPQVSGGQLLPVCAAAG